MLPTVSSSASSKVRQAKISFPSASSLVKDGVGSFQAEELLLLKLQDLPCPHEVKPGPLHPSTKPATNLWDIGSFVEKAKNGLEDSQISEIMQYLWKPKADFKFPTHLIYGKQRKFNFSWLQSFSWLAYSAVLDGAFCLPCVLFGRRIGSNASKLERLMKCPINDWSVALKRFNSHEMKSEVHKTALLTMQTFSGVMKNTIKPIDQIHDKILDETINQNRMKLVSIIKTVLL